MVSENAFRAACLGAALAAAGALVPVSGASAQGTAPAQEPHRQPSAAQAAQQERMKSCNADAGAKHLGGDARKTFMGNCLAGRTQPAAAGDRSSPAQAAQRERMTSCNAEAGTRGLAGGARRTFMSGCLSGRGAAAPAAAPAPARPGAAPN